MQIKTQNGIHTFFFFFSIKFPLRFAFKKVPLSLQLVFDEEWAGSGVRGMRRRTQVPQWPLGGPGAAQRESPRYPE